jgi:crotonobetainyl-CoA:carnitine CoA-transferase CaiB-like acyl-CoA transferase
LLQAHGIPAAAVQNMLDVLVDPHLRARGFVEWIDHPVVGRRPAAGVPWIIDGQRPSLGAAPVLGSDTEGVLLDVLAMTPPEIESLRAAGVLR